MINDGFYRFPHTPHLTWLGIGSPRDDKVMTAAQASSFLAAPVAVEEKVDGANLGISLDHAGRLHAQNRGQYLVPPYRGQFNRLSAWLSSYTEPLVATLNPGLILFGEWCAARHSIRYDNLPGWFIAFDIYDREIGRFWSMQRRSAWCAAAGLPQAPVLLNQSCLGLRDLTALMDGRSCSFGSELIEGVVVRRDDGNWLNDRAKLVRPSFSQAIEKHWKQRDVEWNRLATEPSSCPWR